MKAMWLVGPPWIVVEKSRLHPRRQNLVTSRVIGVVAAAVAVEALASSAEGETHRPLLRAHSFLGARRGADATASRPDCSTSQSELQ
jgi:hypothetical protein